MCETLLYTSNTFWIIWLYNLFIRQFIGVLEKTDALKPRVFKWETVEWRRRHNEEPRDLRPDIVNETTRKMLEWVAHVWEIPRE